MAAGSVGQRSLVEFDRLRLKGARLGRVASTGFLGDILRSEWLYGRRWGWRGRRLRWRWRWTRILRWLWGIVCAH